MSIKVEVTDCDMLGMQLMDFQEAYLMSKIRSKNIGANV